MEGKKNRLVLGGTGSLGTQVCKRAVERNLNVWSLSQNFPRSFPHMLTRYYHPETGQKPWPLDMTWQKFDVLSKQDRSKVNLMEEMAEARTMVHCVGPTKPRLPLRRLLTFPSTGRGQPGRDQEPFDRKAPRQSHQQIAEDEFHKANFDSVEASLELAKTLNVRNFIYISVSGTFPVWPLFYDERFFPLKQRAESLLGGEHRSADGFPMSMAILRPMFFYTDRRPLASSLAMCHSVLYPNASPASTKLTADRMARCVVGLADRMDEVRDRGNPDTHVKWILEDDDIYRFAKEVAPAETFARMPMDGETMDDDDDEDLF